MDPTYCKMAAALGRRPKQIMGKSEILTMWGTPLLKAFIQQSSAKFDSK